MNALIIVTEIFEKAILLILIGLSIWSIAIIIDRKRIYKSDLSEATFDNLESLILQKKDKSQLVQMFSQNNFIHRVFAKSLEYSSDSDTFERALSGQLKSERVKFEKGLAVLATLGSNAPFIGLFGTVLGIIRAFAYLGTQSGSTAVMTGVSQALYATAMGLLVAIPAVVANNYFATLLKVSFQKTESARDLIIAKKMV
ncbi:MAG: MotA/TolQ/ExbB proton channel family protein [Pseudobdellovibrio sp.]